MSTKSNDDRIKGSADGTMSVGKSDASNVREGETSVRDEAIVQRKGIGFRSNAAGSERRLLRSRDGFSSETTNYASGEMDVSFPLNGSRGTESCARGSRLGFTSTLRHHFGSTSNQEVTKADIVDRIATGTGLTKIETEAVVNGFIATIVDALKEGEGVELRGLGSFRVQHRKPRKARNPQTNEEVRIGPRYVPVFRPSKDLRRMVDEATKARRTINGT